MRSEFFKIVPVEIIVSTWAAAPEPPDPSLIKSTWSPTAYPSPESIIVIPSTTESKIDATLAFAPCPPPPVMLTSSPTI